MMSRPGISANILERSAPVAAIPSQVSADAQLMERFRQGDREAFAELYRVHHAAVFRFAFYLTNDRDAAGEITQETFIWLIHHPGRFDASRGELAAFLAGVCRKMARRRERSVRRWLSFDNAPQHDGRDSGCSAERAIDANALKRAITMLPMRYREAVVLCDLEDKSYEEAAAQVGCKVGTIRSRLHRGRELLSRKFLPKRRQGNGL